MTQVSPPPLLEVRDLKVCFDGRPAVDGLDLSLARGRTLALAGESGCGKSSTAMALMGLLPQSARCEGQIQLLGQDLLALKPKQWNRVRGRHIGMIFQEPMTSLNPVYRVGHQVLECLDCHLQLDPQAARARVLSLFERVQLHNPAKVFQAYPHELSGGQRQRVVIAMAIACEPGLLIADEPTTALDATVQLQILQLLRSLCQESGMGLLLISHDLPVIARWADDLVVMHHGKAMERLPAAKLYSHAAHPYTQGLINASMRLDCELHHSRGSLPEIEVNHDQATGIYHFHTRSAKPPVADQAVAPQVPLLQVRDLNVQYRSDGPEVISRIDLDIARGTTLGLVGESGSGKSTLCRALMGLVKPSHGTIYLNGQSASPTRNRILRMVFQDPYASLNPRQPIGDMLDTTLKVDGVRNRIERQQRVREMLDAVGLPMHSLQRFAHEFSGGQRQRVAIARALITRPALVVCDEPVSALDVSVRAQILNLLNALKREMNLAYLFISHDLAVVRYMADEVAVMHKGRIVEHAAASDIWHTPRAPYTRQLIEACH